MKGRRQIPSFRFELLALVCVALVAGSGWRAAMASPLPCVHHTHRCATARSCAQYQATESDAAFMAAPPPQVLALQPAGEVVLPAGGPHLERFASFSLHNRPPPAA